MANSSLYAAGFSDSDIMNYAIRMVIPMRREFGRTLDIPHFLHDFVYAKEIIEQAKASQDAKLRDYAACLEIKIFGPRNGNATTAQSTLPSPPRGQDAVASSDSMDAQESALSEAELRDRMMTKYKKGLR